MNHSTLSKLAVALMAVFTLFTLPAVASDEDAVVKATKAYLQQENPGVKSKTNCLIGQILSVTKEVENQERELLKKHPATVQRTKWLDLRLPDENPYFEIGIWTGKPSAIQWREEDLSEERHWIVSDPGPQSYTAWALEKINLKKIAAAALFGMAALRYVIR